MARINPFQFLIMPLDVELMVICLSRYLQHLALANDRTEEEITDQWESSCPADAVHTYNLISTEISTKITAN